MSYFTFSSTETGRREERRYTIIDKIPNQATPTALSTGVLFNICTRMLTNSYDYQQIRTTTVRVKSNV